MDSTGTKLNAEPTAAERLGLDPGTRALIVNADDFGLCRDENEATIEGLENGLFTSSTILVPAPGFAQVAAYARARPQADLGVHLTLNSEWPNWRWGPVLGAAAVPSLLDEAGYLPLDVPAVYARANLDEAEAELRAQIERALDAGIDVTHLDCHMGPLHLRPDFHELYVRLAHAYRLPIRAVPRAMLRNMGMEAVVARLDAAGVLAPDNFILGGERTPESAAGYWTELIRALPPGVSEVYCHPAYARDELCSFAYDAKLREADFRFFTGDEARALVASEGIQLIGYRELRAAMRGEA